MGFLWAILHSAEHSLVVSFITGATTFLVSVFVARETLAALLPRPARWIVLGDDPQKTGIDMAMWQRVLIVLFFSCLDFMITFLYSSSACLIYSVDAFQLGAFVPSAIIGVLSIVILARLSSPRYLDVRTKLKLAKVNKALREAIIGPQQWRRLFRRPECCQNTTNKPKGQSHCLEREYAPSENESTGETTDPVPPRAVVRNCMSEVRVLNPASHEFFAVALFHKWAEDFSSVIFSIEATHSKTQTQRRSFHTETPTERPFHEKILSTVWWCIEPALESPAVRSLLFNTTILHHSAVLKYSYLASWRTHTASFKISPDVTGKISFMDATWRHSGEENKPLTLTLSKGVQTVELTGDHWIFFRVRIPVSRFQPIAELLGISAEEARVYSNAMCQACVGPCFLCTREGFHPESDVRWMS
ncbi:hypothetical protein Pelo_12077 [Pelomyxa schiedti]|nr:hypothetical protein Pelo_12077 [Pelomyxa schiedti]